MPRAPRAASRIRLAAPLLAAVLLLTFMGVREVPPDTAGAPVEAAWGAPTPCLSDGSTFGAWWVRYNGYGCVRVAGDALAMQPRRVTQGHETSAPLVVGPQHPERFAFDVRLTTDHQLRTGTAPNAWEVAWVAWSYRDDAHFYYFIPKPNGWELGKRDPAYPGGQRFLATGHDVRFPIGRWYDVRVEGDGATVRVWVDGTLLTTFTDHERPYASGRVALYSEDAAVRFAHARLTPRG